MNLPLLCPDRSALPSIAEKLLTAFPGQKVFAIEGEMGAGKTTFIQALCEFLGSPDRVSSPTFALVNHYRSPQGDIYHFDTYRLGKVQELEDIGFTEYIDSGHYCFIEWPGLALPLIDLPFVAVEIERGSGDEERLFHWQSKP